VVLQKHGVQKQVGREAFLVAIIVGY
jgi:hypothetical protein